MNDKSKSHLSDTLKPEGKRTNSRTAVRKTYVIEPRIERLIQNEMADSSLRPSEALSRLILAGAQTLERERSGDAFGALESLSESSREEWVHLSRDLLERVRKLEETHQKTLECLEQIVGFGGPSALKTLLTRHQKWLLEHQRGLADTYTLMTKSIGDFRTASSSAVEIQKVLKGLQEWIDKSLEESLQQIKNSVNLHASEMIRAVHHVDDVSQRVLDVSSVHAERTQGFLRRLEDGTETFFQRLKLTPTVAVSAVMVCTVIALVISFFAIPTYEKIQTEVILQTRLMPLLEKHFTTFTQKQDKIMEDNYRLASKKYQDFVNRYKADLVNRDQEILRLQSQQKATEQELSEIKKAFRDYIERARAYMKDSIKGILFDLMGHYFLTFLIIVFGAGGFVIGRYVDFTGGERRR